MVEEIKFVNWGKGEKKVRMIVIRNNGKFLTLRRLKGSGIKTKVQALGYFKQNNTLYKDRTKTKINSYTNIVSSHKSTTIGGSIAKKINNKSRQIYFVSGDIKVGRKRIPVTRSSYAQGTDDSCMTNEQCREYAWDRWRAKVKQLLTGNYDKDFSNAELGAADISNLREGWQRWESA